MDKVAIDGVNISWCDFYNDCRCSAQEHYAEGEFLWAEECKECPDCYYKQLKRKEQFLEEIGKEITTYRLKYDTTHTVSKLLDSLVSKIREELYE